MDRHADRAAALASLRVRWGSAAPRPATEVFGALAAAPLPAEAGAADALSATLPGAPLPRPTLLPLPSGTEPFPGGTEPAPAVRSSPASSPGQAARSLPGTPTRDADRAVPTGFAELDALLAAGGLPRTGTVTLRGAGSSGATTLALRAVAEAQAGGALVAWVDLSRSLDPVEAVARGVNLDWLAVLAPADVDGALAMAGTLLQAHAVDVLVLDLAGTDGGGASGRRPSALAPGATAGAASFGISPGVMVRAGVGPGEASLPVAETHLTLGGERSETAGRAPTVPFRAYDHPGRYPAHSPDAVGSTSARSGARDPALADRGATASPARTSRSPSTGRSRPPSLADRLARLVAFARRTGALLLVLEPLEAPAPLRAALAEGSNLALELRRAGWVRLGREVVGQRTEVRVAKDRHGAPDRRTTLRLLYAEGGPRDRCLARDELLAEEPVAAGTARAAGIDRAAGAAPTAAAAPPGHLPATAPTTSTPSHEPDRSTDAPPPPRLAPSRAPARPGARSLDPRERAADSRRAAVG